MSATVRETVTHLLESTREVIDQLLALPIDEIPMPSSHTCAQGKHIRALVTNDIDHETIHSGQILEARYEARATRLWRDFVLSGFRRGRASSRHSSA